MLYVAGLIQWHMRPFELERVPKSQKALEKFKRLIGEKMYNDVMVLHEADIKAKGTDAEDASWSVQCVEESLKQYTHALITNHLALCVRNAAISVFSQSLSPVGRR